MVRASRPKGTGRRFAAAVAAAAVCGVLLAARACIKGAESPSLESARELPDFSLTGVTARGTAPLGKRELLGRPWIANFIFTRCQGPCPVMSGDMARLQARLPEAVRLVSFTVDPDHDQPRVLREYAARFGADPERWFFVRGEGRQLYDLMRAGFALAAARDDEAEAGFRFTHSTKFVLVDGAGRIRGYYARGARQSLEQLERDAVLLLKENP